MKFKCKNGYKIMFSKLADLQNEASLSYDIFHLHIPRRLILRSKICSQDSDS